MTFCARHFPGGFRRSTFRTFLGPASPVDVCTSRRLPIEDKRHPLGRSHVLRVAVADGVGEARETRLSHPRRQAFRVRLRNTPWCACLNMRLRLLTLTNFIPYLCLGG